MAARLAHGWTLARAPEVSNALAAEFIRPAIRAVPSSMAIRIGPCRISLLAFTDPGVASQWTQTAAALDISVAVSDSPEHDLAMEVLVCLGQALWHRLFPSEMRAYWTLLWGEIRAGIDAEIDEQALDAKRSLLASRSSARNRALLEEYGRASFAGTAAEYVHALWHDVTVREGPEHLPAAQLRRRLELLSRWFPPDRGYRLFPRRAKAE